MYYPKRLGCKYGLPHDLDVVHDNPHQKIERCQLCGKRYKWKKGYRGRVENEEYLKAHVRNFAQRSGATKEIYHRIYKPEKCKIII